MDRPGWPPPPGAILFLGRNLGQSEEVGLPTRSVSTEGVSCRIASLARRVSSFFPVALVRGQAATWGSAVAAVPASRRRGVPSEMGHRLPDRSWPRPGR
jgi:hypothetical protein